MVAIPDRWHRKFSAVRSPVSTDAIGPLTVPIAAPAATASPSPAVQLTSTAGSSWAKVSVAHARAGQHAVAPRHEVRHASWRPPAAAPT